LGDEMGKMKEKSKDFLHWIAQLKFYFFCFSAAAMTPGISLEPDCWPPRKPHLAVCSKKWATNYHGKFSIVTIHFSKTFPTCIDSKKMSLMAFLFVINNRCLG